MTDVTIILQRIEQGDAQATDQLLPLVYDELRRLAEARLAREKPGQTLQATALVHEAYLRLVGPSDGDWANRRQFFSAAAEAMRRILVERARARLATKRGGEMRRIDLDPALIANHSTDEKLIELDDALAELAKKDEVKAKLVKLRYFAGLTNAEAADALGIGVSTADKYWAYAKSWLRAELSEES
jgi:RNA polymerase sigma factor (TIGR02999 family)